LVRVVRPVVAAESDLRQNIEDRDQTRHDDLIVPVEA
jgi:hypothetical protein